MLASDWMSVFDLLNSTVNQLAVSRFTTDSSELTPFENSDIYMEVDILKLISKNRTKSKQNIEYALKGDRIKLSYSNRGKNKPWKNKILNSQNQPKPLVVPRFIKINETLGEVLGLYYGDGTKCNKNIVEFTNYSVDLIKIWLLFLFQFHIYRKNLHFKIKVSKNAQLKYNVSENEIIDYWKKALNIPREKTIKLAWIKSKGKPSKYLRKYGSAVITYNNTAFNVFFNLLLGNISTFIKNKEFRIGFIRGVIGAEGNINLRKNGSLSLVRIAGNDTNRKLISRILLKYLNITAIDEKNSNEIYFGNIKNFKKIKKYSLHYLHPDKRNKFESGYNTLIKNLNKGHDPNALLYNKNFIAILKMLNKKPLNYGEIINLSTLSRKRTDHFLLGYKHGKKYTYNGAIQLGMIKKIKNSRFSIYSITKKGSIYLRDLNECI